MWVGHGAAGHIIIESIDVKAREEEKEKIKMNEGACQF